MKMLCIYADYKSDESYTPSKISVRVGNNFHNLQEIRVRHWRLLPLDKQADVQNLTSSSLVSAAAGDGGAERLDPHLSHQPGQELSKPS